MNLSGSGLSRLALVLARPTLNQKGGTGRPSCVFRLTPSTPPQHHGDTHLTALQRALAGSAEAPPPAAERALNVARRSTEMIQEMRVKRL
ncbi:hypothetical protein EYF80_006169 [Liparis tanakae]|uniref:Uncharacterized protein n=1 Tax=Liparis tanakae TaxID=230148 RepID=A0A4Z2J127_9TELE|nr:hypothetical protein EYF80_006169 [Liparis tanakae]